MKRITAFLLFALLTATCSIPAFARKENKAIGENGQDARKAAKQQRKIVKRNAKKQRKAMKRYQKAQRKSAKQQRLRK